MVAVGACCPSKRDSVEAKKLRGRDQTSDAKEHRLSAAACIGNISLVESALQEGANICGESHIFGTPLVNAARGGHIEILRFLLAKGAPADQNTVIWTHSERSDCQFELKFLMEYTLFTNLTAPEEAALGGNKDIVALFLDPGLQLSTSSCTFTKALICAASGGNIKVFS
ncbi:hypothetical protein BDV06DRAFT_227328 [Aspergillus oleicola]